MPILRTQTAWAYGLECRVPRRMLEGLEFRLRSPIMILGFRDKRFGPSLSIRSPFRVMLYTFSLLKLASLISSAWTQKNLISLELSGAWGMYCQDVVGDDVGIIKKLNPQCPAVQR